MLRELSPLGQHYFHIFHPKNFLAWFSFTTSLRWRLSVRLAKTGEMLCCAALSSQGVCDVLQRLLDFTNYLIHLVDCHLSYKPDQECSKTLLANQLAWLRSMTSPTLTSWASPIRPSRWSSSWTSSPSPRSYSPSLPPSATVLVAAIPRWRRCWQGQRGFALKDEDD